MQGSVETYMEIGMPGQLADLGYHDVASYINNCKKLDAVTITAANLLTTLTINGTAFTVNSGAESKTETELRDLMIAAVNAGVVPVTAVIKATDELYIESDVAGTTTTVVGTTNCSVVAVIPNELNVPFGVFVTQDLNLSGLGADNIARLPIAGGEVTGKVALGVALLDQATENVLVSSGQTEVGYSPQSTMSILRRGRVYVKVEDAVLAGGNVYVRHVAGAGEQLGAFRSDADGGDADVLPYSRYKSGAGAEGLAILEIALP